MLFYTHLLLEFDFCIAVCGILCVDCCITLRVLQVCCVTVICTVKRMSPSEVIIIIIMFKKGG
jgi:hypothetical protein